jgi:hypothetical protein
MSARTHAPATKGAARAPTSDIGLRRQCERGHHVVAGGACTQCDSTGVLRGPALDPVAPEPDRVPAIVHQVLRAPGQALDRTTRGFMEQRLGSDLSTTPVRLSAMPMSVAPTDDPAERTADTAADRALGAGPVSATAADFSAVRIHADPAAAAAARAVRARAFTFGSHIVFGADEYRPASADGRQLLAHELAHVTQQAWRGRLFRKPMPDKQPDNADIAPANAGVGKNEEEQEDETSAGAAASPAPGAATPNQSRQPPAAKPAAAELPKPDPAPDQRGGPEQAKEAAGDKAPQSVGEIPTEGLALIDEELAEHERWGAALDMVGAAGSEKRAAFIAEEAGGGAAKGLKEGFKQGVVQGAAMHVGMKAAEKAIEKAGINVIIRLGGQAAKFTPLPGIGAMVGGLMAGIDLAKRDWGATARTIEAFGQGSDLYEQLANSIEAISTVIEIATRVANIIAGILGGIVVGMWIVAVATAGVIAPLAATLTAVFLAIEAGTMVLDGINAVVLKELVTVFRALHAFASDADPRDVVTQGAAIEGAASAATGFLGGLAGAKAAEKGLHLAAPKPPTKLPEHGDPPAATGDGPTVKAEPVAEKGPGGAAAREPGAAPSATEQKPVGTPAAAEPIPAVNEPAGPASATPESATATPAKPPGLEVVATPEKPPVASAAESAATTPEPAPAATVAEPTKPTEPSGTAPGPQAGPAATTQTPEAAPAAPSLEPTTAAAVRESTAVTAGGTTNPKYGPVDERSFAELDDVIAAQAQGPSGQALHVEQQRLAAQPATPRRTVSKEQARAEADRAAARVRQQQGMTDPEVQAGHTQAARHTPESGAPDVQVSDPATFQHLHSRLTRDSAGRRIPASRTPGAANAPNAGLNVDVVHPPKPGETAGRTQTTTRHRAQEGLIDEGVARARAQSGGKLTPEGQAAAGQEVLWRTQGTGFDQREVQIKRQSGLFDEAAAIERSPAVQARRAQQAAAKAAAAAAPTVAEAAPPPAAATAAPPAADIPAAVAPPATEPTAAAAPPAPPEAGLGAPQPATVPSGGPQTQTAVTTPSAPEATPGTQTPAASIPVGGAPIAMNPVLPSSIAARVPEPVAPPTTELSAAGPTSRSRAELVGSTAEVEPPRPAAGARPKPAPAAAETKPPGPPGMPPGETGGGGAAEPPISEIEQVRLEEIGEKRRMGGVRSLVEGEFQDLPEERGKALRRGEKVPGRSEVSERVKSSLRANARERFGRLMQEALADESKHTSLTQETLQHLTPAQQDYVRRTGEMPQGFEFHHLLTIADYPEFGDLAESGLSLPKDVHRQAGHGGDTTRPVEAATYADPAAMDRPGFINDPAARKGYRGAPPPRKNAAVWMSTS